MTHTSEPTTDAEIRAAGLARWLQVKKRMDWSSNRLAEILDVSLATLSRWESPTGTQMATLPAALVFCTQSHTSPTWLITGTGNQTLDQVDEAILKAASWDALTGAHETVMEALEQAVKLRTHIEGIDQHAAMIDAKGDAMLGKADSIDDRIEQIDARSIVIEERVARIEAMLTTFVEKG
jgi:hypothetical protein